MIELQFIRCLICIQWDEYYRKLAMKQRRGSSVQRVAMKPPSSTNLNGLQSQTLYPPSRANSDLNQNGQQIRNSSPTVQLPNGKVPPVTQKDPRRETENDIEIAKSRTMSNSMRGNGTRRQTTLSSEKNSTSCTIS